MRADTRTKYDLSFFSPPLLRVVAFFLAITISVRWIGRLIGESLALVLAHTARSHQSRIIVQRFAHLVAYYVHQLLEHRLPKRERKRIDHPRDLATGGIDMPCVRVLLRDTIKRDWKRVRYRK